MQKANGRRVADCLQSHLGQTINVTYTMNGAQCKEIGMLARISIDENGRDIKFLLLDLSSTKNGGSNHTLSIPFNSLEISVLKVSDAEENILYQDLRWTSQMVLALYLQRATNALEIRR